MKMLSFLICCVSIIVSAVEKPNLTPEQRAQRKAEMYKRTGGRVCVPPKGFVALVDCQSRVDFEKIAERYQRVFSGLGLKSQCSRQTTAFAFSDLTSKGKDLHAGSVVFIVDDPSLPMTLVSMESRSGLVNVAALSLDNPSAALLTRRAAKLACRVAMIACGGAESEAPTSMMNTVTTLKELDACEGLGNDTSAMMGVIRGMIKAGVTTERWMTYRQACMIGEEMMPTNEIQRVIWDEVRSDKERGPRNPITILPKNKR